MKMLPLCCSLALSFIACDAKPAPDPAPTPATAPASTKASVDPAHQARLDFCRFTYAQSMRCFADEAYWNTIATMFYAFGDTLAVDPGVKDRLIGTMKDDIRNLQHDDPTFTKVCENMLSTMQLPTPEQMRTVEASVPGGCVKYGQALGLMVFRDKVFFVKNAE
jgi:hypothetical protein